MVALWLHLLAPVVHPFIIWLRHLPLTESNVGSYIYMVAQTKYCCTPYISGVTIGIVGNHNLFMQPYCVIPSYNEIVTIMLFQNRKNGVVTLEGTIMLGRICTGGAGVQP
jgi:hypothetical protein